MVDLPEPDSPTMKVVSREGIKRETSRRTLCSGREGYAKDTLRRLISPLHRGGRIPLRLRGRGLVFSNNDLRGKVEKDGEPVDDRQFEMGRSFLFAMIVRSDAIEFFPFVMMVSCGTTICRYVAASRQAQKTVITSPGVDLPSRTTLAPYQKPTTKVPSRRKSVIPSEIPHIRACRERLSAARLTSLVNRFNSLCWALCALTVDMAEVARSILVDASANALRSPK